MRRIRLLLPLFLIALAAVPAVASARAPGLARVEGAGTVEFLGRRVSQVFGEVDHGRLLWQGKGAPRVVTCADAKPLRRCAVRKVSRATGTITWDIYRPARIFVLATRFRLLLEDGGHFAVSVTGTGTLNVDGTGEVTVASGETHAYDGAETVAVEPTENRLVPRRLP